MNPNPNPVTCKMKLVKKTDSKLFFQTESGCRFTRPIYASTGMAVDLDGWVSTRLLLEPDEFDKEEFPEVQWRLEITPDIDMEHPFFSSTPCWLKPGCKHQLIYLGTDGEEHQAKVTQWWNGTQKGESPA